MTKSKDKKKKNKLFEKEPLDSKANIIKAVVLSIFDENGPTPNIYWPYDLDEQAGLLIAMKTISLLMGDATYQDGIGTEGVNYFGILPFPDLKLNGLTYFFLIPEVKARGKALAATITVLIDEENRVFFYENMKYLRIIIDKAATQIQNNKQHSEREIIMDEIREELFEFANELKDPFSTKRQLKILLTGLDKAGKSSFMYGIRRKYSEIIKSMPTKGVERSEENIFEEQNSTISIWDLGGQKKYRERYLEQSKMYLYNIDLMFFFIDIQDVERIDEALSLFKTILNTIIELDEFPPIVLCLNKFDPDIKGSKEIFKNLERIADVIQENSDKFFIKIFQTSIFDHWSLITAYSFGLSQLSPNRELFRNQLKKFAKKTNSDAILLLNENGIILSNFSKTDISGKVFEVSAPHFQSLYKNFKEFKLLEKDFIVSSGITDRSKKIIFKKITVGKYNLYLLLFLERSFEIGKIEKNLPDFSKNLVDLIHTYI
ncbi:MAG: 50S ribosome-binding GTPase [Candidatus Lokiarchaeota archaeon]|nr:50S ribosome-binding GTPase [Candidatus Lokiarchaeota archaeon]